MFTESNAAHRHGGASGRPNGMGANSRSEDSPAPGRFGWRGCVYVILAGTRSTFARA